MFMDHSEVSAGNLLLTLPAHYSGIVVIILFSLTPMHFFSGVGIMFKRQTVNLGSCTPGSKGLGSTSVLASLRI